MPVSAQGPSTPRASVLTTAFLSLLPLSHNERRNTFLHPTDWPGSGKQRTDLKMYVYSCPLFGLCILDHQELCSWEAREWGAEESTHLSSQAGDF